MALPAYFRSLIGWVSHQLTRGLSALGLIGPAKERFPDLPQTTLEQVIGLGEQAVANATAANQLPLDSPLSAALQGRPQLENVVEVRVHIQLRDAAGILDDMSLRVTVPWGSTVGEVADIIEGALRNRLEQSPGLSVTDINIIPPLLLGPGTGAIPSEAVTAR